MANYQTFKNSLKKLESRQNETDQREYCGVIYIDEYEKLAASDEGFRRSTGKFGFLVIPRPLSLDQWELEYCQ